MDAKPVQRAGAGVANCVENPVHPDGHLFGRPDRGDDNRLPLQLLLILHPAFPPPDPIQKPPWCLHQIPLRRLRSAAHILSHPALHHVLCVDDEECVHGHIGGRPILRGTA